MMALNARICLLLIGFTYPLLIQAGEKSKNLPGKSATRNPTQEYGASIYSQDYPVEMINQNVYVINPQREENLLLSTQQRQAFFKRAQLDKVTASWDHLEKDILILRASENSLTDLAKKYPQIPAAKLQILQTLLSGR